MAARSCCPRCASSLLFAEQDGALRLLTCVACGEIVVLNPPPPPPKWILRHHHGRSSRFDYRQVAEIEAAFAAGATVVEVARRWQCERQMARRIRDGKYRVVGHPEEVSA